MKLNLYSINKRLILKYIAVFLLLFILYILLERFLFLMKCNDDSGTTNDIIAVLDGYSLNPFNNDNIKLQGDFYYRYLKPHGLPKIFFSGYINDATLKQFEASYKHNIVLDNQVLDVIFRNLNYQYYLKKTLNSYDDEWIYFVITQQTTVYCTIYINKHLMFLAGECYYKWRAHDG